jgi:uncharacterized protein YbaA (DUF1428 family)
MAYVEISVIPVKKDRLDEYKKMAKKSAKLFMSSGALSYVEAIEDDVKPGKTTSFPQSVKQKPDEVLCVAVSTFKNRKARDAGWKKMMKDPFFANMDMKNAPFDLKRMYFGGFKAIAEGA